MVTLAAVVLIIITTFYVAFFVVFPIGRGAVFFPSRRSHALRMAELSGASYGDTAVDLGSGDGRVVIALARRGAESHGYEINPALVLLSRWNARRAGLLGRAHIHWGSFWRADLGAFNAVTVFQGSFIMKRLEKKLLKELAPGARVVSDYWAFPNWKPEMTAGTLSVYQVAHRP
ncbi:MAG TPA: hypothetical protein VMM82_10065 [Spirochaetia bacterium]|nr:hypothetical protein [Spirochaetia bacterium]